MHPSSELPRSLDLSLRHCRRTDPPLSQSLAAKSHSDRNVFQGPIGPSLFVGGAEDHSAPLPKELLTNFRKEIHLNENQTRPLLGSLLLG